MGNPGYQEGGRMNSVGRLGIRVIPFAPSLRGSLGELRFITCGDNEMLESMITFLVLMILSFLLFSMMLGSESQAFRMWQTTLRINLCARDGFFPLLS